MTFLFTREKRRIPDAELLVMQTVWDAPATLSIKQIIQKLQENGSQWGTSTIRTLLDRLVKRNYLAVAKQGSERYYAVLVDEQTYLKQATSGFLSQHYKNSLFRLVSTLADGWLSQEELQNLEDIVSKLEE